MVSLRKEKQLRDLEEKIAVERIRLLDDFAEEPYLGYDSIEDAAKDCKLSSQTEVLARLLNKENVFISGPAGSGKTTIIKKFISILDAQFHGEFNVAVTASTGLAAKLIDGKTVHSWSGLGIYSKNFNPRDRKDPDFPKGFWTAKNNVKYTDVLIIDEISMLPAYYLDNIDKVCKYYKRNNQPFGGIQVIFLGDFLQLPPVPPRERLDDVNYGYAITSDAWKNADVTYCYMDKTHRASDKFLKYLLSSIENNKITPNTEKILAACMGNVKDPQKNYTTLFTTNNDVDKYNQKMLDANNNKPQTFKLREEFGNAKNIRKLIESRGLLEEITLKEDAIVIVTSNVRDPDGQIRVANGSVGKITKMRSHGMSIKLNNGEEQAIFPQTYELTEKVEITNAKGDTIYIDETIASVSQYPVKLGYAITVHKSQGQTFDGVEVDLSKCFTPGLGYVALSRIRDARNLVIKDFSDKAMQVDEQSLKIAKVVKKRAANSRKEFLDDSSSYDALLTIPLSRTLIWDVDNAGMAQRREDEKNKK